MALARPYSSSSSALLTLASHRTSSSLFNISSLAFDCGPQKLVFKNSKNLRFLVSTIAHSASAANSRREAIGEGGYPQSESFWDRFLALAEVACIAPSCILSLGFALQSIFQRSQNVNIYFSWQIIPLLGAVIIGAVIRSRQWSKIASVRSPNESLNSGGTDILSLAQRVRKLEEDVSSSVIIIRVLSRQLEKLGVRFRITRRTLRDPINETAALAEKAAKAVRALTVKEAALEKELRESHQIMLAMQEQQQKQLELVLSIGKLVKQLQTLHNNGTGIKQSVHSDSTTNKGKLKTRTTVNSSAGLTVNSGKQISGQATELGMHDTRYPKQFSHADAGVSSVHNSNDNAVNNR